MDPGTFVTTTTLLDGLRDPKNAGAWGGFVTRYRPVVVGYARKFGLGAADAEDVAQAVLTEFVRGYAAGGYDRGRGRLRGWLFGIARNQVQALRRKRAIEAGRVAGDGGLVDEAAETDAAMEQAWEHEWNQHVLRRCLVLLRESVTPQTLDAFVMFVLEGQPAEVVGARLGMTANAVFGAKRRVLERVEELRTQVEDGE